LWDVASGLCKPKIFFRKSPCVARYNQADLHEGRLDASARTYHRLKAKQHLLNKLRLPGLLCSAGHRQ
jgi:hypothetical protein